MLVQDSIYNSRNYKGLLFANSVIECDLIYNSRNYKGLLFIDWSDIE